ncbi:MAG: hypothetical protein Q8R92_15200, partial [Deltaproteobacteria bacterium]|nr:hypothetical protein [Deltaproteobacteria bacterium]
MNEHAARALLILTLIALPVTEACRSETPGPAQKAAPSADAGPAPAYQIVVRDASPVQPPERLWTELPANSRPS